MRVHEKRDLNRMGAWTLRSRRARSGSIARTRVVALTLMAFLAIAASGAQGTKTSVAVLPFPTKILGDQDEGMAGFGDMFAENLMTRLGELPSLRVLERSGIDQVVGELKLQRESEDLFDPDTVLASGKLGMTDYVILGSALVVDESFVQLNLRLVEKATGRIAMSRLIEGMARDLFDKSDELVGIVLAAMDARLSSAEEAKVFPKGRALYQAMTVEGSLADRIEALEEALERQPESREGWKLLAMLYREAGEAFFASDAMYRVLELSPGDTEALFFTAGLAFEASRFAEAERAFRTAADAGFRRAESYFHLGLIKEFDSGGRKFGPDADLDAAKDWYRAVLELEPNHAPSLFNLGYISLVLASRQSAPNKTQYELIKAEVEYLERYLECAPSEDAGRLPTVREQVAQHRKFLAAWEKANP